MDYGGEHPPTVAYETPAQGGAVERNGPYRLVRDSGGSVRITGVYRTIWGRARLAVGCVAGLGMALLILGAFVDGVLGRSVIIDLRQFPPVFAGSWPTLSGIVLLVLAVLCWLVFPALTWRRFHRLDIDAGPDELIIRQLLPTGDQIAGRWKASDVERIVAAQYELTIRPREGAPATFALGGPWTAAFWLTDRIGEATDIATSIIGRE